MLHDHVGEADVGCELPEELPERLQATRGRADTDDGERELRDGNGGGDGRVRRNGTAAKARGGPRASSAGRWDVLPSGPKCVGRRLSRERAGRRRRREARVGN